MENAKNKTGKLIGHKSSQVDGDEEKDRRRRRNKHVDDDEENKETSTPLQLKAPLESENAIRSQCRKRNRLEYHRLAITQIQEHALRTFMNTKLGGGATQSAKLRRYTTKQKPIMGTCDAQTHNALVISPTLPPHPTRHRCNCKHRQRYLQKRLLNRCKNTNETPHLASYDSRLINGCCRRAVSDTILTTTWSAKDDSNAQH